MSEFRYSPQKVYRFVMHAGDAPELVATYDDATVRDQGKDGWLSAPQAMLRAYSNDPEFFGSEDYRLGNGIGTWTQEDQVEYVKGNPSGKNDFTVGVVYDCDSDLALKRIMMNVVISTYNFGHGSFEYIGFVSKSDDPDRRGDEYDGWGYKGDHRVEKWRVVVASEERDDG